ncbi:hypothetical protein SDC9_122022 [bioreactor metagenome]|uniref:Uncharacterized protein n=1 Tax=bioreactor metagenome TaxID=1076179 RepID=A0A645CDP1_9ZZZZ
MKSRTLGRERIKHGINLHNGFHREVDPFLCTIEHFPDTVELILMDEITEKKIFRELDGYLPDLFRRTLVLLPYMFQLLTGNKCKVVFADNLDGVAHDTPYPLGIFNIIDLKLAMGMERVGELRFPPVGNIKTILIRQRSDFMYNMSAIRIGHQHLSL